jgi:hypothetical protein
MLGTDSISMDEINEAYMAKEETNPEIQVTRTERRAQVV